MGCTSSRSIDAYSTGIPNLGSQPSGAAHLVALKSSTYGALSVDSQKLKEDPRESDPVNEMYQQMLNVDASGSQLPQSWSEVSNTLSRLKTEVQQNRSVAWPGPAEAKAEPQAVDIMDLLEDVDEEEAESLSEKSTVSRPRGDKREIHTLEELDKLKVSLRDDDSSSASSSDNEEVTSNFLSYYDSSRQPAFKAVEQGRRPDKRFSTSTVLPRSRTSVAEKKPSKSISSTRSETSALFDPEFLASFQEAFEKLSATMPSSETGSQKSSNKFGLSESEFSSRRTAPPDTSSTNNSGRRPVGLQRKDAREDVAVPAPQKKVGDAAKKPGAVDVSSTRSPSKKKDGNGVFDVPQTVASPSPGVQGRVLQVNNGPKKPMADPVLQFEKRCPPDGEQKVVFFSTTLRGIRKTFEDCNTVRSILQSFNVEVDERDVSMDATFRQQLKDTMEKPVPVPRLFIKGRYIGGAEEVLQLHEKGTLAKLLEGLPSGNLAKNCDGCGGARFIPCTDCSGSCKVLTEDGTVTRCPECNENGLMRCPICS